jgi:hypothetical protein
MGIETPSEREEDMSGYFPGDKVHVEFDAIVTEKANSGAGRTFTHTLREVGEDGKGGCIHYIYLHSRNATVTEPVTPQSWPPKIGDIWEADGHEYFVYKGLTGATIFPVDGVEDDLDYFTSFDKFKKLKPKLVRRAMSVYEWDVNFRGSQVSDYLSEAFSNYRASGRRYA